MKLASKLATGKRLFAILVLFLPLSGIAFTSPEIISKNVLTQQKEISELFTKTAKDGQVPVIVGLKLPAPGFKPEGTLASLTEVKEQRDAIAATREALLNSLAGYKVVVYAVYDSVPYVAMKVDSEALRQLAKSPYVTSIQEDSPEKPHKNSAATEPSEDTSGNTKSGVVD